ncbi:carbohydrate ABC transporter permease [Prauserella endophytica]|uniref:Sugar ABC transporter permease n=1 Tax=Prauserella endophytica TaxID=1592324 RepID=A0ABY2RSP8_9PSEU|nr:sugar ABC transporter permease [Prauserella endophytica]TKG58792.1 sugar ABC transporter permease [Prauserella endophytica]
MTTHTLPTKAVSTVDSRRAARRRGDRTGWLFASPALIVLVALTVGPTLYLLLSSFSRVELFGGQSEFVGLGNFAAVLTDPEILSSLLATLVFVVVAVSLQMLLGLGLAIPLSAKVRGSGPAAALMLLPFAVAPAVSALLFRQLVNPNYGWVNHYLGALGVIPADLDWLGRPATAWLTVLGLDVWQWTPFVALILMAGLQSLSPEVLEAAEIDGASRWQAFRHVTLPMLTPFLGIALVLRTIQAFKTFDSFQVLTRGGPGNSTEIVNLAIYRIALQSFRIGAAAAVGLLLLVLLLALTPVLLRLVGRRGDNEEA